MKVVVKEYLLLLSYLTPEILNPTLLRVFSWSIRMSIRVPGYTRNSALTRTYCNFLIFINSFLVR